jgi:GH15 family glucan-1,4-alpha-glucosidase
MLQDGKDTYAYMWPRDAAFTALALARSGDEHVAQNLFAFCNDVITDAGYLMHKYRADKSLGSSWHPWFKNGKTILPIQEDETALVLFALYEHYLISRDLEFIESIYNSFIKKSAQFLMQYRNSKTGLPEPSYDLWEEKFGVHTFTAASVVGALNAAAAFADLLGKTPEASLYREVADDMKTGIMTHLYDEKNQNFYKGLTLNGQQQWVPEPTVDASSVYGIFAFGVLQPTDHRLKKAFHQSAQLLTIQTEVGGIARYVGDTYYRTTEHAPGNPWILTTLWFAQYYAAIAKTNSDLDHVVENLSWAVSHAFPSGVLSEQLDPYTGKRLSAAPLTWSHAEFVRTVFAYLDALERLGICQTCNPIK